MLRKLLACAIVSFAALASHTAWAAPEANKATAAELDAVKGIGPGLSSRILDARKKSDFKNWADLMDRVKGIRQKKAAALSAEGLTVNGESFKPAAPDARPATPAKPAKG